MLDIIVRAGEAKLRGAMRLPKRRTTDDILGGASYHPAMDFTQAQEFHLFGVGEDQAAELRSLGFEVEVRSAAAAEAKGRTARAGARDKKNATPAQED